MSLLRTRRQWGFALLLSSMLLVPAIPAVAQATPQQADPGISERSTPINSVPEKREEEIDENAEYKKSAAVVKLGSLVGLNADHAAMVFQILNFLVLAAGVGYLALKLLPKQFRERSSHIQRQLVEARTATEEANARLSAVEARLSRLDDEVAGMRSHVEADMARDAQRLRAAAEEETLRILAAADAEIQTATAAARRDLQRHAAELAVEQAARRVTISAAADRALVQGFVQRLSEDHGGGQN